ncbi:voltage-dependent P/Q-type calcium channel subunit alpha-1A-like [Mustela putorius furo]|uniref:Voltage-dependent P/Q-type calcium channel subunit alpha-1A-like n=2 Tax=Mustela putorius furo TaxID=9669 RepID=A0A8U0R8F7_MUSPF|nr:voltage-dependent P/Q-type calcium channel subunit alpha-1A-like [Mustela putorius furo]
MKMEKDNHIDQSEKVYFQGQVTPAGVDQYRTGVVPSALSQTPALPVRRTHHLCPAPGRAREAQSERLLPSNRPNSNLDLHGHINTQGVSTSMRREPRPSLPGGLRHRCPRHFDTPLDPDPEVSGAPTPLEPLVTHRASRVCGRRLRPARSRRSPRTCRASPRRCELPAASARPRAAESAARGWVDPEGGRGGARARGCGGERGKRSQASAAGRWAPPAPAVSTPPSQRAGAAARSCHRWAPSAALSKNYLAGGQGRQ